MLYTCKMNLLHGSVCLLLASAYLGQVDAHVAKASSSRVTNMNFHQLSSSGNNIGRLSKRELAEIELSEFQDPIIFKGGSFLKGLRGKIQKVAKLFLNMRVKEFLQVAGLSKTVNKLEKYSGIKKRDLNEMPFSEEESKLLESYTHGLKDILKTVDIKQFTPLLKMYGPEVLNMKVSDLLGKFGYNVDGGYEGGMEKRSVISERLSKSLGKTLAKYGASIGPTVLTTTAKTILTPIASLFGGSYSGVSKLLDPLSNLLSRASQGQLDTSSYTGTKKAPEPVSVEGYEE